MSPDRDLHATVTAAAWDLLADLRRSWPPPAARSRGYRPLDLAGLQPAAILRLDAVRAVAAILPGAGSPTALPLAHDGGRWRVASAGDGVASALLGTAAASHRAAGAGSFRLHHSAAPLISAADEQQLGTDQTNLSVVVDGRLIVKWRTAPDADGRRAARLRRHLQAVGFTDVPDLEAYLTWTDGEGDEWVLADVDRLLPGARDGWDHAIDLLSAAPGSDDAAAAADALPATLGALTARLHAAFRRPSELMPHPTRMASRAEMQAVRADAAAILRRALAIEAAGATDVDARAAPLRRAIASMPVEPASLQAIHGDLHLGQVVPWRDGIALIDFDGAPAPTEPAGAEDLAARDVAHITCSLWNLAAVVDARTEGSSSDRLREWAAAGETELLAAYHSTVVDVAADPLDGRMLEGLMAEQFCRELVYAAETLPRWRYAPLQALRWRYPSEGLHER